MLYLLGSALARVQSQRVAEDLVAGLGQMGVEGEEGFRVPSQRAPVPTLLSQGWQSVSDWDLGVGSVSGRGEEVEREGRCGSYLPFAAEKISEPGAGVHALVGLLCPALTGELDLGCMC